MAKATRRVVKTERVVVEEKVDGVTLELTNGEARLIAFLCYHCGGRSDTTARVWTDEIRRAIEKAGVDLSDFSELYSTVTDDPRGIYLNEKSRKAFK